MTQIQPLRLLAGWTVELNNFFECEPDSCSGHWEYFKHYFNYDLLQLTNRKFNLVIDLGWYPDMDEKGSYVLVLIKDHDWKNPLEFFESRDTKEIVEKIEYWTNYDFYQKYL